MLGRDVGRLCRPRRRAHCIVPRSDSDGADDARTTRPTTNPAPRAPARKRPGRRRAKRVTSSTTPCGPPCSNLDASPRTCSCASSRYRGSGAGAVGPPLGESRHLLRQRAEAARGLGAAILGLLAYLFPRLRDEAVDLLLGLADHRLGLHRGFIGDLSGALCCGGRDVRCLRAGRLRHSGHARLLFVGNGSFCAAVGFDAHAGPPTRS